MINADELYESDDRFKRYVDRYCNMYNVSKEIALEHRIVLDVMKYYSDDPIIIIN